MSNGRKCANCRFYVPFVDGAGVFAYAECHRHPPTAQRVPSPGMADHMFPAVFEWVKNWPRPLPDDWCGEWRKE